MKLLSLCVLSVLLYYDQCRGGEFLDVKSGDDVPYIPLKWNDHISSLVLGPRCELFVWNKKEKGYTCKFSTGAQPCLQEVKKGLLGD
ncbi:hypothetical protein GDO86_005861 [Hymenochirus boettgeri]|uniref:Uncharacterized protein n=1 Tax=Hymenochirus boettgeri TaxID=247094 RepID=A0A8T2J3R5_9PIPI|nr:hypothetical protein GDO86_005861 [Hymenochirus boettgeri]